MLQEYFIRILNMSLTGAAVIAAVLLLRLLLRRAPKSISYCLWAVVLFRLLCPVSFSLPVSLLGTVNAPAAQQGTVQYIPEDLSAGLEPEIFQPIPEAENEAFFRDEENRTASAQNQTAFVQNQSGAAGFTLQNLTEVAGILWCAGVLAMLLYGGISLAVFKRSLKGAYEVKVRETAAEPGLLHWGKWPVPQIYCKKNLPTSFVLGVFRPRIYLPEGMTQDERRYVLLHEQIHIRRGDPIIRMVSYLALCIHWFNPLVWAAFFFSGRDMEMSCDEAVIRRLGSNVKKEYSASLLTLATGKHIFCGAPLAFGEGDTGSRIRNVLKYKKPGAILVGAAAAVGILAAVFLLANPRAEEGTDPGEPGGVPVTAEQEMPGSDGQEEVPQQGTDREEETEETLTDSQGGIQTDAVSEPEESDVQQTQGSDQPDGQEGDSAAALPTYDIRALYPSYDTETPQRQLEILQSLDWGEALTMERLEELLEEPEPLLELYSGYQDTGWGDGADDYGNAYMSCLIRIPETGIDLRLRIRYLVADNSIADMRLERLNDHLGITLYARDHFYYGYNTELSKNMDAIRKGTGELFLWIEQYGFPASNENNIYIYIRPDQFRTDLGEGWSGMTYKWLEEEPEWAAGSREWGPREWRAPAAIMQVSAEDFLTFSDGVLSEVQLLYNHAERVVEWEPMEYCEEQAMICMFNVDQYTLTEIDEAEEAGDPIPEEYYTANIWYVCIGREDSPWCYVIAMNQRHFSKEEAVEFARSIRFREAAWQ